ncbi:toprim domain-containing protein [Candidatus Woesearchaeota archaeon]|nr:toprim domain-containing protein [Candidatus Woesearchaeota archaeon]
MNNIENIKKEIFKIINNNYLVIVEGKKDKKALNELGIKNVIFLENKPLFEIIEMIYKKDVVILTDLDTEGKKLFNKFRHQLQRNGIKIHYKIRELLFKTKLRHIEGLNKYLKD